MDKGVFVSRKAAETTTLKELLQSYLDNKVPALADPKREENRIKFIQRHDLALRIVATIRSRDIADYVQQRESEGAGGNTIRLDLGLISRVFNHARRDLGMESLTNPVAIASKPKIPGGRTRRLEDGELNGLLAVAPEPFCLVIRFAIESAMRREEIASLKWRNVDFARRTAYLSETKNGDERTVPLSANALRVLRETKVHNPQDSVFGMSADAITHAMKKACVRAGIQNLRFHDLRHEATSRLFENTDLDIMEIKTITGHRSLQMLARYSHLRTHRLAARLDGARRGEPLEKEKKEEAPKKRGRPRKQ